MYEKKPWAHLYATAAWKRIRRHQLSSDPLCKFCRQMGRTTAANVCDHITPHKGDEAKFYGGPFQSLCKACHDGAKQSQDKTGRLRGCDVNGNPVDPNHTWHQTQQEAPHGAQDKTSNDAALSGNGWRHSEF